MNPRCHELQVLRLVEFYRNIANWPPGAFLKKIDGIWMLLPPISRVDEYPYGGDGMSDLREMLAEELWADVHRQTEGRWPIDLGGQQLEGAVDGEIDFLALADRVLGIPAIASALSEHQSLPLRGE